MRLFLYGVFDRPPIREMLRSRSHVDAINLVFCGFTNLVFHARAANPKHFGTSFFSGRVPPSLPASDECGW